MVKYKKTRLWVYVTLAVIPLVLFVGGMIYSAIFMNIFKDYILDFGQSVDYATDNDCMRAELNGVSTRVTAENADEIFLGIFDAGYYEYLDEAPTGDYLLLDFGDGNIMKIFYKDAESIIVDFIPLEGKEIIYSTRQVCRFVTFERLVSLQWGNEVWVE